MATSPVRKISETILDFGSPFIEQFDVEAQPQAFQSALTLVITVWNAHVMATSRWGQPQFLADLKRRTDDAAVPSEVVECIRLLSSRRQLARFMNDARAVGEWAVVASEDGWRLRCDARAPGEV